jgi:hypothetical protein
MASHAVTKNILKIVAAHVVPVMLTYLAKHQSEEIRSARESECILSAAKLFSCHMILATLSLKWRPDDNMIVTKMK